VTFPSSQPPVPAVVGRLAGGTSVRAVWVNKGGGLRVPVGRQHPRQRAPGRAEVVPVGDDRRARCSRRPTSSAAGSIRYRMFLPRCRSQRTPAQKALSQIWNVEDKRHPYDAVTAFQATYGAKFAKANARITDDVELLACYDLRHRPLPEQDQQGSRLPGCRNRHGLQADRSRAGTVP
jgi:hypothetical protein